MSHRKDPHSYTDEMADALCTRVSSGETISAICREPDMPSRMSIHNWMGSNDAFRANLLHAIELRADHWAEQVLEISDDDSYDTIEVVTDTGELKIFPNTSKLHRDRMRIDTRKWLAQKLYRKRYGDHQEIEHKGEIGNMQPIINVTIDGNKSSLAPEAGDRIKDASK